MPSKAIDPRVLDVLTRSWSVRRSIDLYLDIEGAAWDGARSVSVTAEVDSEVARRWLPFAFRPSLPTRATFFIADYPKVCFGVPYREAGVLLHARYLGEEVLHCAWMVVDDDTALILGRELLGFPKKLAEIDFELSEKGAVRAAVRRRGVEVLSIQGDKPQVVPGEPLAPKPIINAKGTASVMPASLWRLDVEQRIHQAWNVKTRLGIEASPFDPLHELSPKGAHEGQALISDIALPHGPRRGGGWNAARRFLYGLRPAGWVSHKWMVERLPFRTM